MLKYGPNECIDFGIYCQSAEEFETWFDELLENLEEAGMCVNWNFKEQYKKAFLKTFE